MREKEYGWYLIGCERFGYEPISPEAFMTRWNAFEEHAESLKKAEKRDNFDDVDGAVRAEMQRNMKDDPFVKAVLVGMAEESQDE